MTKEANMEMLVAGIVVQIITATATDESSVPEKEEKVQQRIDDLIVATQFQDMCYSELQAQLVDFQTTRTIPDDAPDYVKLVLRSFRDRISVPVEE